MFAEKQFFVRSSKDDFEMCSLDALGIKDENIEATNFNHRYIDQIVLRKDGFYETPLPKWPLHKWPKCTSRLWYSRSLLAM